ncbi:MAG: sensor histidine kinase [Stackebrandtia sp.]
MKRLGRPWSLRTRLVASSIALIAVVAAVIAVVTTVALRSYMHYQLDRDLREDVAAAERMPASDLKFGEEPTKYVLVNPGQPVKTITAQQFDGEIVTAVMSDETPVGADPADHMVLLNDEQKQALQEIPLDGQAHTVDVPGLGGYRAQSTSNGTLILAYPLSEVDETLKTLILVEVIVTAAGLVAAGLAGAAMVDISLRPLRRVAATATRVSKLPLHTGEVALRERVPKAQADPRTEVGKVGAALNRMLAHVNSALTARQASETRMRQFVADASHELRTPLTSIRGYAEFTRLQIENIDVDTRHALGRIESESVRMTGLVEDLLLLARLDSGRPLEAEEVDIARLAADAVNDARAAGSDHRWLLELPDKPAVVRGDEARLRQVLVNLLANARTHTQAGAEVTTRVLVGGRRVTAEVCDDGPGIPPDVLPHVFDRFARGDASRARDHGGAGLGLAIVQAIAQAHNGKVRVDSEPGSTVFAVELPRHS